jgi:imidazolonepropionase-like amidohydrolase
MIDPVTPHLRAEDALNPADPSFKTALAAGVTTLCILPGSANIFGGSGVIVNPVGQSLNQMLVKADTGLKCAFGENPKNVYSAKPQGPNTRMGIAGLFRIWMTRALEYAGKAAMHSQPALPNKKNEQDFNQNNSFSRDLKLEVLAQVLSGERLLRIHVHRADDIMTVLRLCDEFNIKPCLEHATQAGVVADELLKRGTLIAYGPVLSPPKKQENDLRDIKTAADLIKKGALLALTTDHPVTSVSTLQICAAMLMRHNVSRELALASITRNAAALCGLQSEIGTLEPGKRADMVLWSGDPLDARNIPIEVYIKGEKVLT